MRPMGRLRWKMLALMLCGTVVIYVDRNVLGVLAPILKKESELLDGAVFLRRLGLSARLFLLAAGRGLSDRSHRAAHRLRRRRSDLGRGRRGARPGDRMDLDGGVPRGARPQRSRRDPDGHEGVDHLVSLAGAVDRDRLVQFRLLNRFDDHAAPRDLDGLGLWLAAGVPDHRHARRPPRDRLVLALPGSRGASGPLRRRARLHHLRP